MTVIDQVSDNIKIVFDGAPGPEAGRFVEVEDAIGRSFSLGRWQERDDGLWEIEFANPLKAIELLNDLSRLVDGPNYSHERYERLQERIAAYLESAVA